MNIDLLIKNGHVVDPLNKVNKIADVALAEGKVLQVAEGLDPTNAKEVIDATGLMVTPGIVDPHVHVVPEGAGGLSFHMLLRKGVTTTLDMAGPIGMFLDEAKNYGCGINAGCLQSLAPKRDLKGEDASAAEIGEAIDKALAAGAFGIKIMGGHFPFTPETTGRIIEEADKRGAYIAFHAGSTVNGSNINAVEEALELAGNHPLHLAHANAYCRGQVEDVLMENKRLLEGLKKKPNVISESYLSVMNGTGALINKETGRAASGVTRMWLERKGYATDAAGMAKAIKDGWCCIYGPVGSEMLYLSPEEGLKYWESKDTDAWCSFPVNSPVTMVNCATARRDDGSFVVNALCTDGGFIPRNVILENGLRLAQMRYMELEDVIAKATYCGARMVGLTNKGHLTPGADGDVAVFHSCGKVQYTIIGGQVRMAAGICFDGPGRVFTSKQGQAAVQKIGLDCIVPDLAQSDYLKGHAR